MDRIIRQITEDLTSRLPDGPMAYQTQQLRDCDFPPFLVRRIYMELEQKLAESMMLPQTDWANTESEAVQQSWQHFLNAIRAETHLPASYAKAVIETAVADIMAVLVQPRKNIPDLLFGDDEELSAKELAQQCERLVVYTHFNKVLTSYVKRKELGGLQKDRCKDIIRRVDTRLTGQYTPLQWAQMLDPLFVLVGKKIDTDLLRLFFEDKKKPRTARKFDLMDAAITRAGLIEVLSSPDLLNYQGYKPDQSELFNAEKETEDAPAPENAKLGNHFTRDDDSDAEDEQKDEGSFAEDLLKDDSPDAGEPEDRERKQREKWSGSENATGQLSESEEDQPMEPEEDTVHSLNDIFFSEEDEEPEEIFASGVEDEQKNEASSEEVTSPEGSSNDEEQEVPKPNHVEEFPETDDISGQVSESEEEPLMEPEEDTTHSLNDIFANDEDEEPQEIFGSGVEDEEDQKDEIPRIEDTSQEASSDVEDHEIPEQDYAEEQSKLEKEDIKEPLTFSDEPLAEGEEAGFSLNDMFLEGDEEPEKLSETQEAEAWKEVQHQPEMENDKNEDVAIWQRFVDADEPAQENSREESVADVARTDDILPAENNLEVILQENKSYFVKELFGGSEKAYKTSLQEIERKRNWKEASKLIEEHIFKRNAINIYSEAAVDFTDRLQVYFSQT